MSTSIVIVQEMSTRIIAFFVGLLLFICVLDETKASSLNLQYPCVHYCFDAFHKRIATLPCFIVVMPQHLSLSLSPSPLYLFPSVSSYSRILPSPPAFHFTPCGSSLFHIDYRGYGCPVQKSMLEYVLDLSSIIGAHCYPVDRTLLIRTLFWGASRMCVYHTIRGRIYLIETFFIVIPMAYSTVLGRIKCSKLLVLSEINDTYYLLCIKCILRSSGKIFFVYSACRWSFIYFF